MRCCSSANGATRPSFQTTISPSSTVPSGSALRQRDDLREALGDELLAARPDPDLAGALDDLRADAVVLPLDDPVGRRGRAGRRTRCAGRSSGWARKNGYGWPLSSGRRRPIARQLRVSAPRSASRGRRCSPSCAARRAWRRGRRASASARCTSSLLTPTRKPPPISLLSRKRPACRARPSTTATRAACSSASRPRSGSRRSSTHSARPTSLVAAAAAAARARSSRRGRRPPGSTRRTASRRCRRGWQRERAQHARSARPGAACRRRGSRPPTPRRAAPARGEVALQRIDLGDASPCCVELGEEAREALHAPASSTGASSGATTIRRASSSLSDSATCPAARSDAATASPTSPGSSSSSSPYSVAKAPASQALLARASAPSPPRSRA